MSGLFYFIIGTSNRLQDIDPCFRRGGRFELEIPVLNLSQDRSRLLSSMLVEAYRDVLDFTQRDGGRYDIDSTEGFNVIDHMQMLSDEVAEQTGSMTHIPPYDANQSQI